MDEDRTARAAQRGSELGAQLGEALGAAAGSAANHAVDLGRTAASLTAHGAAAARSSAARFAQGGLPEVRAAANSMGEVLEGVVEDVRERSGEVVDALSGRRRLPRRWPWMVGAAAAGAAVGAGAAMLVRRVVGEDAPGAQEPEQLVAVVDPRPAEA